MREHRDQLAAVVIDLLELRHQVALTLERPRGHQRRAEVVADLLSGGDLDRRPAGLVGVPPQRHEPHALLADTQGDAQHPRDVWVGEVPADRRRKSLRDVVAGQHERALLRPEVRGDLTDEVDDVGRDLDLLAGVRANDADAGPVGLEHVEPRASRIEAGHQLPVREPQHVLERAVSGPRRGADQVSGRLRVGDLLEQRLALEQGQHRALGLGGVLLQQAELAGVRPPPRGGPVDGQDPDDGTVVAAEHGEQLLVGSPGVGVVAGHLVEVDPVALELLDRRRLEEPQPRTPGHRLGERRLDHRDRVGLLHVLPVLLRPRVGQGHQVVTEHH